MKNKANVTNASIDSAGLPKDYRQAIAEYIWNGFDAKATHVNLYAEANELGHIQRIVIEDNGEGIPLETLNISFGNFLDSLKKKNIQRSSYTRGKKGKGRFSFSLFATRATWHTVYLHEGSLLEYSIVIERNQKDEYEDINKVISKATHTGTKVILEGVFGITAAQLSSAEFNTFLAQEFGWFLLLNKDLGFNLSISDEPLAYEQLILEKDAVVWTIADHQEQVYPFRINYIRWGDSIGDRYYYYFLNKDKVEIAKELTSYNNNAIDFHHSVYIESPFFDSFERESLADGEQDNLFSQLNHHIVYRKLNSDLKEFLYRKQKKYIKEKAAATYLADIEQKAVLPVFSSAEQDKKQDLLHVIKELYCIQPKIFMGIKTETEKTLIGLLHLLLSTPQRDNILPLMEQLAPLTEEERSLLSKVLKLN
ncbi:ATP-binding protein [Sphingobacterium spiritivorum]|uniref:ATP-binding protein n=1 Tax=Sphingobacterium spiritivorum TaxID=258 RepID=UPI00191AF888|nr:ATP-binding protein [Sphingobacterium spiritivorum]QQT26202.1 ATP-binding protein [Sphingobacterium spiritivorum]